MELARQGRDRLPEDYYEERIADLGRVPAFFKVILTGHTGRANQTGKEEAELALNVLRLFVGSYYWNFHRSPSRPICMGISGTLPAFGRHSSVFHVYRDRPTQEQLLGGSEEYGGRRDIELNHETVEDLRKDFLPHINQLLRSLGSETETREDVARRLPRVINWFGKASTTNSIAESFLMYAISLEGLLSEGRTPKEEYARRVAALLTRNGAKGLYPFIGYLSSPFVGRLRQASSRSERFTIVKDRVVELFGYRNDIAHGRVLEDEIEASNLLDMESLIRNSILSFLDGGWNTLKGFKAWLAREWP
jgi:hypothetical protein